MRVVCTVRFCVSRAKFCTSGVELSAVPATRQRSREAPVADRDRDGRTARAYAWTRVWLQATRPHVTLLNPL